MHPYTSVIIVVDKGLCLMFVYCVLGPEEILISYRMQPASQMDVEKCDRPAWIQV